MMVAVILTPFRPLVARSVIESPRQRSPGVEASQPQTRMSGSPGMGRHRCWFQR